MRWKRYKKGSEVSYAVGAFPTRELLEKQPEQVEEILLAPSFTERETWEKELQMAKIPYRVTEKELRRLYPKDNVYVIGVFRPCERPVRDENHIVLDAISDMGNAGTIMRTMLARGIFDLVTIGNTCDLLHPRTVRASMGACFALRHSAYPSLEAYRASFPSDRVDVARRSFFFYLTEEAIALPDVRPPERWSLVFGNEGSGLPPSYAKEGTCVHIPQAPYVDSINLPSAVAMGIYEFTREQRVFG